MDRLGQKQQKYYILPILETKVNKHFENFHFQKLDSDVKMESYS